MAKDGPPRDRRKRRRIDAGSSPGSTPAAPPPIQDAEPVTVVEKGSFATAQCSCGWTGPGRRSRKRARADAAEHVAAVHPSRPHAG